MAGIEDFIRGAIAHAQAGRMGEAVRVLGEGLALEPASAGGNGLMGTLLHAMGRAGEAVGFLERAHAAAPGDARLAYQLGAVLMGLGQAGRGIGLMTRAVEVEPRWVQALNGLAGALHGVGDSGRAVEMYQRSLGVDGGQAEALCGLGGVMVGSGKVREAAAAFREAGRKHPANAEVMGKLLSVLNYTDDAEPGEVFEAHRRWGEVVMGRGTDGWRGGSALMGREATTDAEPSVVARRGDPEKRLRVGLLSPDLYDHSCAYFVRPILANRDRGRFEMVCYSWSDRADWMTAQLKGMADGWREVGGLAEQKLVEMIRGDGIDVLVELSGHTAMGPLAALRNRAAPVQATYLGYPNTTGLPTIDWRIVDGVTDPTGAEELHTERLMSLEGCFVCYSGPEFAPEVGVRSGAGAPFTFGSFNSIRKINPSVVAAWAGVLKAVPGSRMLIKTRGLSGAYARGNIAEMFSREGIGAERIEMHDMVMSKAEHLGMYGRADVALDTFPYNGTTTTCEALWMGVPVVTLEGRTHAGRVGMSLLRAAGLGELVARDVGEFVQIAAGLARDPVKLSAMRAGMRERVRASRLCDAGRFGAEFYGALRRMWGEFCGAGGGGVGKVGM